MSRGPYIREPKVFLVRLPGDKMLGIKCLLCGSESLQLLKRVPVCRSLTVSQ